MLKLFMKKQEKRSYLIVELVVNALLANKLIMWIKDHFEKIIFEPGVSRTRPMVQTAKMEAGARLRTSRNIARVFRETADTSQVPVPQRGEITLVI